MRRLLDFYRLQVRLLWQWRGGRLALLRRLLVSFVVALVAFEITVALIPGLHVNTLGEAVFAVIVMALLNAAIRPVLLLIVQPLSVIAVAIVSVLFQVVVILLLVPLVPGIEVDGFWAAFWASWLFAIVNTLFTSILDLDRGDSYYGTLVRQLSVQGRDVVSTDRPGLVVIQIDGLAHPVFSHQVRAGQVPVMSSWMRTGSHHLARWEAMLPSQTSASQAGILHGNNDGIPAFRWYEKKAGRLMVSNHPADATEIVRRISNGEGLLSRGGASVNNLVSGDATRAYLTMATLREPGQGLGDSRAFTAFFLNPSGYLHTTVRFCAEALKELFQARRQRRAGVVPRMHRGGVYPIARAATNVLLRDVGVALVMEEMYRGTPVIYIDFTDYDEIAHHSGPERAETLQALDGVDAAIGTIAKAAGETPRPYEFIIVSDHGQSLGSTFLQRYGETLQDVVRELMGGEQSVEAATSRVEDWGPINSFASELSRSRGVTAAIARRAFRGKTEDGFVALGPKDATVSDGTVAAAVESGQTAKTGGKGTAPEPPDLVVVASGNLGLVYFNVTGERMTVEQMGELYPGLVDALANHPGIGLLLVRSAERGAVAIGRSGVNYLDEDRIEGDDPVAQFPGRARESLLREDRMEHCPDIVVISLYDPETDEVAAFEELIGSHGGLGGPQTSPMILYPSRWTLDEEVPLGAPAVYRNIRAWLLDLGIDLGARDESTPTAEA
jgi:uncharacterized membrane protein YvlD (DUF360 family)